MLAWLKLAGVTRSTIRGIRNVMDKIRSSVRASTGVTAKVSWVSSSDLLLEKMESVPLQKMEVWSVQKHHDIPYGSVWAKAPNLYNTLKREETATPSTVYQH